jgi:hypothetical protein
LLETQNNNNNNNNNSNNNKIRVVNQKLQIWYLTAQDTTCGAVITKLLHVAAWLSTKPTSLLATLTPEPPSFKEAFTYSDLTQKSVMILQIPESYLIEQSAGYRPKSTTSVTEIKAVHNIFFSDEKTKTRKCELHDRLKFSRQEPYMKYIRSQNRS